MNNVSRVIAVVVVVQVVIGGVKIYVAAVKALRKNGKTR
jgi:hypothetical protein